VLADVVAGLRCPVCDAALQGHPAARTGALTCPSGHSYDIARQGYVNLLTGPAPAGADTAEMVAARAEVFAAGHFDGLIAAVAEAATINRKERSDNAGLVLDVGAGTGHYLAAVLERTGEVGLALDISVAAARRAARAHPRLGAVVADVWRRLPVGDGCVRVVLDVFAPRHPAEFHRVLRPDGVLVVVTPRPEHLARLVDGLGLLGVDPQKQERLDTGLGRWFEPVVAHPYTRTLTLDRADAHRLAAMGPSAFHLGAAELAARVAALDEPIKVELAVSIGVYRPNDAGRHRSR
jgi:23S rRNA (guanine745-N1)-methyltransferase